MYRVSVFKDNHFQDEYWFDCYEERELSSNEEIRYCCWKAFIRGTVELMTYIRENYPAGVLPSEMTDILKEFCEQFGEIKELDI